MINIGFWLKSTESKGGLFPFPFHSSIVGGTEVGGAEVGGFEVGKLLFDKVHCCASNKKVKVGGAKMGGAKEGEAKVGEAKVGGAEVGRPLLNQVY